MVDELQKVLDAGIKHEEEPTESMHSLSAPNVSAPKESHDSQNVEEPQEEDNLMFLDSKSESVEPAPPVEEPQQAESPAPVVEEVAETQPPFDHVA